MASSKENDQITLLNHSDARNLNEMESLSPSEKRNPKYTHPTKVTCGKCNRVMFWPGDTNAAKCPYCFTTNHLSACREWVCAFIFTFIGLLVIALAVGLTAGTIVWSLHHGGIFVVWTGLFVTGLIILLRAAVYCCTPCFCMTKGHIFLEK